MATAKQRKYAENRGKGISREQSAILAGYAADTKDQNTTQIEASEGVQQELARIRAEAIDNTGVTKEEIVDMLMKAAGMAQTMADPMGMIAAARELGKMLGFYAPEVKKTLQGVDQDSLKKALADMSDAELAKIANARVIDGEFKRLPEKV